MDENERHKVLVVLQGTNGSNGSTGMFHTFSLFTKREKNSDLNSYLPEQMEGDQGRKLLA